LLVLDEVTPHVVFARVSALWVALWGWGGAVVLVSHDRWFVRGVVEGVVDEEEGSDVEDEEEEEEGLRRRVVYKLAAGKLSVLERGVDQFEEGMERRVRKLMAD
jgi:ATPase subunit of ABC transporter with duplicated ATPase domains